MHQATNKWIRKDIVEEALLIKGLRPRARSGISYLKNVAPEKKVNSKIYKSEKNFHFNGKWGVCSVVATAWIERHEFPRQLLDENQRNVATSSWLSPTRNYFLQNTVIMSSRNSKLYAQQKSLFSADLESLANTISHANGVDPWW
jgi:hypothetical protein